MFLRYNLPGLIWALIILILLALPQNDFPDTSFLNIPNLDKIVHAGLFFVFVFLLARGFALQQSNRFLEKYFIASAFLSGVLYATLTELLQENVFTWRMGDTKDFLADAVGCISGLIFFFMMRKKVLKNKPKKVSE